MALVEWNGPHECHGMTQFSTIRKQGILNHLSLYVQESEHVRSPSTWRGGLFEPPSLRHAAAALPVAAAGEVGVALPCSAAALPVAAAALPVAAAALPVAAAEEVSVPCSAAALPVAAAALPVAAAALPVAAAEEVGVGIPCSAGALPVAAAALPCSAATLPVAAATAAEEVALPCSAAASRLRQGPIPFAPGLPLEHFTLLFTLCFFTKPLLLDGNCRGTSHPPAPQTFPPAVHALVGGPRGDDQVPEDRVIPQFSPVSRVICPCDLLVP